MVRPSKAPTEVELTFLLLPGERLAVSRDPLLADATETDMSSVYYDTPDWALRKHGITLRVRHVQGRFVQTVKREAESNLFDRGEWETEIGGPEPDRAAFPGTPAGDILGAKGPDTLTRLFSTEVGRTSRIAKEGPRPGRGRSRPWGDRCRRAASTHRRARAGVEGRRRQRSVCARASLCP